MDDLAGAIEAFEGAVASALDDPGPQQALQTLRELVSAQ